MPHANAPLTERGRLRLARCVVDDGWPLRRAAERFQVSPTTAKRWADRYRADGPAGMVDRPSRPHRSPRRTPAPVERKVLHLRAKRRWGPARIGGRLGLPASTCHAVLRRAGVARRAHLDRATGRPVRRYEHAAPGDLVHVDVKKLGNIPDGGGWRIHGRARGDRNSRATTKARKNCHPVIGYAYLHTAIDDHSRLAYTEILNDERKETAAAFWQRAHAWFASCGITVRRVITDNGSCYKSFLWRDTLHTAGISMKKTRPFRPQTNGKVERFHRTLADEWAYAKAYSSETARRKALPAWLHAYNHHRAHTALGGHPPASRVPNLSGQNS
ncbi:IS481 family transposase [Micromonospora sp. RP3T]|uniref:IS481 family transposase n=1 Tax=Micromonospora sp. RP3T TaxID=2135446 RepID=UPI003D70471C